VEALGRIAASVPISVVMSGELDGIGVTSVELDQRLGARLATEHLLHLGHGDIAHVTGPLDIYDARARLDGWERAMREAGATSLRCLEGDFTARSGFDLAHQLLAAGPRPTAVFTGNDQMAIGALAAFSHAGLGVPADISVVGFDDIAGADYLIPPLTTVRQDFFTLGSTSVNKLIENLAGEPATRHLIPPTLVPRDSSGPPHR